MQFHRYHGLGNDYLVVDPKESDITLDIPAIKLICDHNFGVGSDGILYGPIIEKDGFRVRIYNPDGSEAEKSGNGLRIFSRYLYDAGLVKTDPFTINTLGGKVKSQILDGGDAVRVEMGRVSFVASEIPMTGIEGEVINKEMTIEGRTFRYCAANIGNPHCVVICDEISPELAKKYGPHIENHPMFPNRTNVQFLKALDRQNIRIEIWERGAGYTLASGSSSTASAAVAKRLGLCGNEVTVNMPGGKLQLEYTDDFQATMVGPVVAVCDGTVREDFFEKSKRR